MSFARQGLFVLLTRLLEFFISMASVILVARALGPEGRGKYALMTLIPMVLTSIATLGITNANVYLLKQKKYAPDNYITNSILFACAASVLVIGMFFILYKLFVYRFLPSLSFQETFVPLLVLPVSVLFFYLQNILLGLGAIAKYNLSNILLSGSFFVFLLALMANIDLTASRAVYVWMCSSAVTCIVTFWLCVKDSGFRFSPDRKLAMEGLRYGIKAHVGTVLLNSRNRLELVFIGYFMNDSAVGLYSIALGMMDKFDLLNRTVSYLLFAEVSASGKLEGERLTATVARNSFWLMVAAVLPLILMSRQILLLLYGREFLLSRYPLCILLLSTAISALVLALGSLYQGRGSPHTYSLGCGIGLVATALLDLALVPGMGLVGAAVANVAGTASMCCFYLFLHLKGSDNRLGELLVLRGADLRTLTAVFRKGGQPREEC